jgi:heme/copper-type cytochrome/quinol oxidase subunit 4
MNKLNQMDGLKRGVVIFIILAVLTAIEYVLGILENPSVYALLWIIAILKAGLVLWYFMHLQRVFRADAGEGDH